LRGIFTKGFIVFLLVGIIYFFGKLIIYDLLVPIFRPLIVSIIGRGDLYLVVLLTIAFTILVIFVVGLIPFGKLFRRQNIEKSHGAFVIIDSGTYFIAAIIKKVRFKKIDGKMQGLYVLFSPYSPFPWSGLPIIFAKEENVIPLKVSYRELYSITASLGTNTPEVLEEEKSEIINKLENKSTE
jgi:hypothetical protein